VTGPDTNEDHFVMPQETTAIHEREVV
jgi:hypothetical protein